jgi:hypothetical protein
MKLSNISEGRHVDCNQPSKAPLGKDCCACVILADLIDVDGKAAWPQPSPEHGAWKRPHRCRCGLHYVPRPIWAAFLDPSYRIDPSYRFTRTRAGDHHIRGTSLKLDHGNGTARLLAGFSDEKMGRRLGSADSFLLGCSKIQFNGADGRTDLRRVHG